MQHMGRETTAQRSAVVGSDGGLARREHTVGHLLAGRRGIRREPKRPRRMAHFAFPQVACVATVRGTYGTLVRLRRTYSSACPRGKLPCASGTYSTQEADTRIPHVQYGGFGAYVSA